MNDKLKILKYVLTHLPLYSVIGDVFKQNTNYMLFITMATLYYSVKMFFVVDYED